MKIHRLLAFLFTSIATGLAAAFVVVMLRPGLVATGTPQAGSTPGTAVASYADAVKRATPAVVNIYSTKLIRTQPNPLSQHPLFQRFFGDRVTPEPQFRRENSLGSGVVMDRAGYVLTNHHVVAGASEIRLVLNDGQEIDARVLGSDPETDLAVLHISADDLTAAVLATNAVSVGDVVLAIGNPFAVGQTVTLGIVSATGRNALGITNFEDFIQTDAAINPGNSGGALVNADGEVVGINTAIFSRSGGSHGIGFAIPVALAQAVMDQIIEHGRVIRGWLGISGQAVSDALAESLALPSTRGVIVAGVLDDGPADRAGIQPGDVILAIDDAVVDEARQILDTVAARPPGTRIEVRILRDRRELTLAAEIAERPRIEPNAR